ncbi:MAG TPA: cupin domain-containing protein, partial [Anaerolineae bacterium]|nr:cupin domain-containing protein [Anaerolineae bacterium]
MPHPYNARSREFNIINKINLAEKLAQFNEHWSPRVVAQLNNYDILVVKVPGEFTWHKHEETDEFFQVISGQLTIRLRDREIVLSPGELFIVPRGIEHQPCATQETPILLIEPRGTPNIGDTSTAAPRQEI